MRLSPTHLLLLLGGWALVEAAETGEGLLHDVGGSQQGSDPASLTTGSIPQLQAKSLERPESTSSAGNDQGSSETVLVHPSGSSLDTVPSATPSASQPGAAIKSAPTSCALYQGELLSNTEIRRLLRGHSRESIEIPSVAELTFAGIAENCLAICEQLSDCWAACRALHWLSCQADEDHEHEE